MEMCGDLWPYIDPKSTEVSRGKDIPEAAAKTSMNSPSMGPVEEDSVSSMVKDLLPALKTTEDAEPTEDTDSDDDDLSSSDCLDGLGEPN